MKYEYVDVLQARKLEQETLDNYLTNGWIKLNSVKTGGLGAMREKWTVENIRNLAKFCATRSEFRTKYSLAYAACSKKKMMWILDELFPKSTRLGKDGKRYVYSKRKWTDEKIWFEAKKQTSLGQFRHNDRKAYRAAERWGLLDLISNYYRGE